jgi:NADP-dependent 3-hydroxy acid dehydrogenase YdfG
LKKVTGKDNVHYLKLDLGDLSSCADAAKELASKERKLDILFLNAYFTLVNITDDIEESCFLRQIPKQPLDMNYSGYDNRIRD